MRGKSWRQSYPDAKIWAALPRVWVEGREWVQLKEAQQVTSEVLDGCLRRQRKVDRECGAGSNNGSWGAGCVAYRDRLTGSPKLHMSM